MKMNRRNALIGLGAIATGGGALFGSGAFTSVEADRTVSVDTAGDGSAYLQLNGDGNYVTDDGGSSTLTIDLGQVNSGDGFNENARTVVEGAVTATNNAADGQDIVVGFDDGGTPPEPSTTVNLDDSNGDPLADVTLYFGTETNQTTKTISPGGSADVGVIVDTRSPTGGDGQEATVTIYADGS